MFKHLAIAAVSGIALMAGSAQALPTFSSGSFAFNAFTSTTTNVTTTTSFTLSSPFNVGSPTGDFGAPVVLPASLLPTGTIFNFLSAPSFDFTDAGLGAFVATLAPTLLGTSVSGPNASATWDVEGTLTLGSDFANAGSSFTANETFSLTQTGGPGNAVSISGTFHSPAVPPTVPEPVTISLFGAGLAALGFVRRKK